MKAAMALAQAGQPLPMGARVKLLGSVLGNLPPISEAHVRLPEVLAAINNIQQLRI